MNPTKFYVYIHKRPDLTPFYVGKGHGSRATDFWGRNPWHKRVVAKHGRENIVIEIIPCCSELDAFNLECVTIADLRRQGFTLANITDGGEGFSGIVPTPESNAKRAAALRGKKRSPETIEKMRLSLAALHLHHTPEARAKISAALRLRVRKHKPKPPKSLTRKPMTAETKAKISAARLANPNTIPRMDVIRAMRGPVSAETRAKQSATRKGKTQSPETIAKRVAAVLGQKRSPETRARMSAAQMGKSPSAATRAKQSEAAKRRQDREIISISFE